jgi:hypothetical protein
MEEVVEEEERTRGRREGAEGEREQSGREEEACEREQSWTRWATRRERRWGLQGGERMRVDVGVSAVVLVGL